jgi:TRAP-type mannitol/chloroaromatic compound transport system substrate-binding protein
LLSTKPVNKVADYDGLVVRSIGARAAYCAALGASTTYIPGPEVYTALAAGTIEAATWSGPDSWVSLGWYEVAKYAIYPPISWCGIGNNDFYVNPEAWNSLPTDLQDIVQKCGHWVIFDFNASSVFANLVAWDTLTEAGVTRCEIPQEEYPLLLAAAQSVWEESATTAPRSREVLEIVTNYMKDVGYID